MAAPDAFAPAELGPVRLRNRIVKAATFEGMTRGNLPTERLIEFHRRMAAGGVGLTTVAFCAVSRDGIGTPNEIILSDAAIPALQRVADAVHAEGAAVSAQIGHAGAVAAAAGLKALSPSPFWSPMPFVARARRPRPTSRASSASSPAQHASSRREASTRSRSTSATAIWPASFSRRSSTGARIGGGDRWTTAPASRARWCARCAMPSATGSPSREAQHERRRPGWPMAGRERHRGTHARVGRGARRDRAHRRQLAREPDVSLSRRGADPRDGRGLPQPIKTAFKLFGKRFCRAIRSRKRTSCRTRDSSALRSRCR